MIYYVTMATNTETKSESRKSLERWLIESASLLAEIELDEQVARVEAAEKRLSAYRIGGAL